MTKYLLSETELESIHKQASQGRCEASTRLRLLCIYWAGSGKKVEWIHQTLMLPMRTIYQYLDEYYSKNKTKNKDPSGGRPTKLSAEQEEELKEHLDANTYSSTAAIIEYVSNQYGVGFSQGGLAKWLSRNGFRYIKTSACSLYSQYRKTRSVY